MPPAVEETLDFDPDALRDKYREERDKRLRTDGNSSIKKSREISATT